MCVQSAPPEVSLISLLLPPPTPSTRTLRLIPLTFPEKSHLSSQHFPFFSPSSKKHSVFLLCLLSCHPHTVYFHSSVFLFYILSCFPPLTLVTCQSHAFVHFFFLLIQHILSCFSHFLSARSSPQLWSFLNNSRTFPFFPFWRGVKRMLVLVSTPTKKTPVTQVVFYDGSQTTGVEFAVVHVCDWWITQLPFLILLTN